MTARPLAVVTGASAGIGREFCEQLAARDYDLVVAARDEARLAAVEQELESRYGIDVTVFRADLTRDDDVGRLASLIETEPRFRLLVNNAGFGTLGTLAASDPGPQEAMVRLHVVATMRLAQAAARALQPRGEGAIINVSSVASFMFSPGNVNYCATKAYVTNFSEGLAAELRPAGVRVQALCPGFTHSEFHHRANIPMSGLPRSMWLSATEVVSASLHAIERGGPVVCVPGVGYRAVVALLRCVPRRVIGWAADRGRRRL